MTEEPTIQELNQAEELKRMQKRMPTNQDLRAETHNHVRDKDGAYIECNGRLEILDAFGTKTEDNGGLGLTDSRFSTNTAITYDYAYVTLECQNPECKYPRIVMDNPRRVEKSQWQSANDWRTDGKKAAGGER